MTTAEIQAELKRLKITQKAIANKLGVVEMSVSNVIHKTTVSDRIMRAVASAIGKHHHEVFPEYYLSATRKRRGRPSASVRK